MNEEDPLEDAFADESEQNLSKSEITTIGSVTEAERKGFIDEELSIELKRKVRNGKSDEAIERLHQIIVESQEEDALDDALEFDDEEKEFFANKFAETLKDVKGNVDEMSSEVQRLTQSGVTRGDLKQYLRGKKSSRTKKSVDALFDAIDGFQSSTSTNKGIAKMIATFTTELNISEVKEMLEEIEARAEHD